MAVEKTSTAYTAPDAKTLAAAGEIDIIDESGKAVQFQSLYSGTDVGPRQLIIFIRHYFCGHCEHYVHALAEHLSPERLAALTPPVKLSLIGCGQQSAVAEYKKRTKCPFPLYSNPDKTLYAQLALVEDLSFGNKQPDYIKSGMVSGVFSSLFTALGSGSQMLKGGDFRQNGGELIFENGELTWLHRMQHTRDHAEIVELEKALGI